MTAPNLDEAEVERPHVIRLSREAFEHFVHAYQNPAPASKELKERFARALASAQYREGKGECGES